MSIMPKIGDTNWGSALNQHLAQLNSLEKGGIQTWASTTRPTKKLVVSTSGNTRTGANLDAADEGLTGINTSTNTLERWDGTKWVSMLIGAGAGSNSRVLTANFIYYVNNNGGNNANDGLTPATAWATPQYAMEFIARNVILNGFQLTIKIMDSTTPYTGFSFFGGSSLTTGLIEILGNPANPDACIIDTRDNSAIFRFGMSLFDVRARISVRGFKFIASVTTMPSLAIMTNNVTNIFIHNCIFTNLPTGSTHLSFNNGTTANLGSYQITGGAAHHINLTNYSTLIFVANKPPSIDEAAVAGYTAGTSGNFDSTVVNYPFTQTNTILSNNPNFANSFIRVSGWSVGWPNLTSYTYSGSATGKRYDVNKWSNLLGVIFPGNVDGTIDAFSIGGY